MRSIVDAAATATMADHPGCRCTWETVFSAPGYALDEADPRLAPIRAGFELAGEAFEPSDFRSHSDAVALHARGLAPIVCGPGDLAVAHTVDEHIPLEQLDRAAVLYAAIFTAAVAG